MFRGQHVIHDKGQRSFCVRVSTIERHAGDGRFDVLYILAIREPNLGYIILLSIVESRIMCGKSKENNITFFPIPVEPYTLMNANFGRISTRAHQFKWRGRGRKKKHGGGAKGRYYSHPPLVRVRISTSFFVWDLG